MSKPAPKESFIPAAPPPVTSSSADIAAQLAAFPAAREAARAALAAAKKRRSELLVAEASDAELANAEADIATALRGLDRLDAREANLKAQQLAAAAPAKEAAWLEFWPPYIELQKQFLATMRTALEQAKKLRDMTSSADSKFNHVTVFLNYPPDHLIDERQVEYYARDMQASIDAEAGRGKGEWL